MGNPVQERLIAIPYEALDQDACRDLHALLGKCLVDDKSRKWELVKSISTPKVTMPEECAKAEAPDWSKMKMFVDRCYQYRQADKNVIIQFCKDFMTINVAAQAEGNRPCPAFQELVAAFEELLPFVRDVLIKKVRLRGFQYEVVYRLSEEHLKPLLQSRYHEGRLDYLNVFGLLRSFNSDVNRDEWELDIPLRQELAYHVKGDSDRKKLKINVFVNNSIRTGWFANIDFVVSSELVQDMKTSDARLDAFVGMLPQYDDFQRRGLRRLLTDDMSKSIEETAS